MAETSLIWDSGAGGDASPHSEADTAALFAALVRGSGVINGYLNSLEPTVSGSNVLVNTGWAMVDGHPYRNSASKSTAITVPAIGTTGHRLVLRANWAAQTVRITDIASADGTATIPAATQTPGTTYDVTLATFTITTLGAITLTDAREFAAGSGAHRLVGSSLAEVATTSTVLVDLIDITGLNIPVTSGVRIVGQFSRTGGAGAQVGALGFEVNGTAISTPSATTGIAFTSANNQAEDGIFVIDIAPRGTDYQNGWVGYFICRRSDGVASVGAQFAVSGTSNPIPNAAITSITITAINNTSNVNIAAKNIKIYEVL